MEREKELAKLINVLRRTARVALQSQWTEANGDAAKCGERRTEIATRLGERNVLTLHYTGVKLPVFAGSQKQIDRDSPCTARRIPTAEWEKRARLAASTDKQSG